MKNPKEFYNLLAQESGIIDVSAIKQVYHGLERLFTKKLRQNAIVWLPGIGEFELKETKRLKDNLTGLPRQPFKRIRFSTERSLKDQIRIWE
jgi:nucleoid DNA-binding protein